MTMTHAFIENGAININKDPGLTSQDVVRKVKQLTKLRKIGHAGTLDPIAGGVLPILCGKATRLFPFLLKTRKTYCVTMKLGEATDTMDRTGKVTNRNDQGRISEQEFQALLKHFIGNILQEPPMYSAQHFQGKRLYKLARKGVTVPREKKQVAIHALELVSFSFPQATVRVQCDRGTYMRVLCDSIGQDCGLGAHLFNLTRECLGPFNIKDAVSLSEFSGHYNLGQLASFYVSMNDIIGFIPAVVLSGKELTKITFGNAIQLDQETLDQSGEKNKDTLLRIVTEKNELKAVAKIKIPGIPNRNERSSTLCIQPICVF